jgi:uncharacterized protein (DUF58 family)
MVTLFEEFEEETNLKSYLIVDASKSMDYASEGHLKKIEYASYVPRLSGI